MKTNKQNSDPTGMGKTPRLDDLFDSLRSAPRDPDPASVSKGFESRLFDRLQQTTSGKQGFWKSEYLYLLGFDVVLGAAALFMLFSIIQDMSIEYIFNGWHLSFF